MHGDVAGVILSVLLIGLGYLLYVIVQKKDVDLARKILHIWVSNWYFIYAYVFDTVLPAVAGLIFFALFNAFLELRFLHTHRYGTVHYPIMISVLLLLHYFGLGTMPALGCAVLSMGYGDGFAAIVGSKVKSGHVPFVLDKTIAGSLTMFLFSTVVVLLIAKTSFAIALLIGLASMVFEAYTPFGLDNVTVPIVVYFLVSKLC